MLRYSRLCQQKDIDYVFDPGQALPLFNAEDLVSCIRGCRLLISNEYEQDLILKKTGLQLADLVDLAGTVVVTRGERGSSVITAESRNDIPSARPRRVVDPTGAGDAYRGGLLSGLVRRKSLQESARLGSVCSSFCVECYGTQEYTFSPSEFDERMTVI